jgi:hypothetical protein
LLNERLLFGSVTTNPTGSWATEPVNLVDDDDVDPASLDIVEQLSERRPLQAAAGKTSIIIVAG